MPGELQKGVSRQERLHSMYLWAKNNSSYYKTLYNDLPIGFSQLTDLPITKKKDLMNSFDKWIVDQRVNYNKAKEFVSQEKNIGKKFLGEYNLVTTSGTTGLQALQEFQGYLYWIERRWR
jgi:phenylacetate-CoA ligase